VDIELQGITIGVFQLRFYSLMILLGLFAGIILARREAARLGEKNLDHVINITALGAILALVGARLYHVFDQQNWPYYRSSPEQIFAVWNGGIGIYGATAGAVLGVFIYAKWKRISILQWLDIGAPAFLLGQAFGRWGNFFNRELFGFPSGLPWAIPIQEASRPVQYQAFERFHPLFIYESILSFIGVVLLLYIARRFGRRETGNGGVARGRWSLIPGDVLLLYFIWYPLERFGLEFLRIQPWSAIGLPVAQWVSGILALMAISILVWRHMRISSAGRGDTSTQYRSRAALRRRRRRLGLGAEESSVNEPSA
jgi:phosphatidylglycerol:prolipoprotein diacylglycerol transferase